MRPDKLRVYLVKTWHIPSAFFQSIFFTNVIIL